MDFTEARKWGFVTEEGQFHGKCHGPRLVPGDDDSSVVRWGAVSKFSKCHGL